MQLDNITWQSPQIQLLLEAQEQGLAMLANGAVVCPAATMVLPLPRVFTVSSFSLKFSICTVHLALTDSYTSGMQYAACQPPSISYPLCGLTAYLYNHLL